MRALLVLGAWLVLVTSRAGATDLAGWANRLESASEEERRFAVQVLAAAGERARDVLRAATRGADPEARYLAHRLLDRLPPLLPAEDPVQIRKRVSRGGGARHTVTFVNRRSAPVKLLWIDFGGGEQLYGTIAPGQARVQSTMAGHLWVVADLADRDLGGYEAIERDARVEILPTRE